MIPSHEQLKHHNQLFMVRMGYATVEEGMDSWLECTVL
jgi:hypothetical protein